jgi:hypothetical protein
MLQAGRRTAISAWTVDSGRPGPALFLLAAQHGNEIQGAEAIRRFVGLAARQLIRGRLFAVPFANPLALADRRPHYGLAPEQPYSEHHGRNMDLTWPGRARGPDSARMSHALYEAFGRQATHCLDLHAWSSYFAPCLVVPDTRRARALAARIGHRFVFVHRGLVPANISGLFNETGRTGFVYEFSGQYCLDEEQVRLGLRAIVNLARAIGLLDGRPLAPARPVLFSDRVGAVTVKTPRDGLFVGRALRSGGPVRRGAVLGHLLSADLRREIVRAPVTGFLRRYGAGRPNSDVSLTGFHACVDRDEELAVIWQDKRTAASA